MKGLRKYLTPFAPDQSGAVSVLYELGGIIVICDAGGCAGNVCGFDEPRWTDTKSAVFSAGLRDMDAIMGSDERLAAKICDAADHIDANFIALIGTPVPAVIGTDFRAVGRMINKKCHLPVIFTATNGMELFDKGEEAAYLALFDAFAKESCATLPGRVGIIGATPQSLSLTKIPGNFKEAVCAYLKAECSLETDNENLFFYGMGAGLEDISEAAKAEMNLVISPSGLKTARLLKERFGTPYKVFCPGLHFIESVFSDAGRPALSFNADYAKSKCNGKTGGNGTAKGNDISADGGSPTHIPCIEGKNILVVHQHVMAASLGAELLKCGAGKVTSASYFMPADESRQDSDVFLKEENDFTELVKSGDYDIIIADTALRPLSPDFTGEWIDFPHFALSGRLLDAVLSANVSEC